VKSKGSSVRESPAWVYAGLLAGSLILAGCVSAGHTFDGDYVVTQDASEFQYAGAAESAEGRQSFTWEDAPGTANVELSAAPASGSLTILVTDERGGTVFTNTLTAGSGQGTTATTVTGDPGAWTIAVTFEDYQGSFAFTLTAA
jgi:hypothetical protein